ncbi:translation initiation factor IF-3 [Bradymonadaceae bacterium TMQ3]|uniref:Translation initiation factor IF-3 n=1 Tax=Lujinxingia sediminis TaxID=2480984 RepID=A0ABY0CX40_9DELT|nr:translation initiation factor IF-3 [Lujinxingia sediminis]RDV39676.1 translation initiation factor IF-3 [Bradymonadaceae bacterium TMQ3]RVU48279.1 translation initiation factor IF-3 [Lujinxingia sediminis]TXC77579.1 translation initiation factor IF-3 [Bradymonadales bacterium TMQ1]
MADKEPKINRRIRAPEVRVIDPDGEQLGIMSSDDALEKAEGFGLDLVEVAPQARPPVVRIMDYGKFKYQQKKRTAEARKKSSRVELKEVKFRPKTDEHDFQTKLRRARRFLEENNKVKLTVMFRGREITHPEIARTMLQRAAEELADAAQVEQSTRMEGRNMTLFLTPKNVIVS